MLVGGLVGAYCKLHLERFVNLGQREPVLTLAARKAFCA